VLTTPHEVGVAIHNYVMAQLKCGVRDKVVFAEHRTRHTLKVREPTKPNIIDSPPRVDIEDPESASRLANLMNHRSLTRPLETGAENLSDVADELAHTTNTNAV
jgi:hypothetical protein